MMSWSVGRNREEAACILAWQLTKVAAMANMPCTQGVMNSEFLEASLLGSSTFPAHNTVDAMATFISDNGSNGKVPAVELAERAVTVCNYTLLCSNPGVQAYGATSKKCGTCGSWTAFAKKTVAATQ
ncbi:hypothetical protein Tco_0584364 [Tanacetum coccineum]